MDHQQPPLRNNRFQTEHLDPAVLKPMPGSPRNHPKSQMRALTKSVQAFGQVLPILADSEGQIISGLALWQVATELGLPDRIVWRQPFPGPGLGIRVVGGEVTAERLDILREADAILQEEIRAAGLYRELWQSFCVLPVVRSVGVQGDGRSYAYPIVVRAVTSADAMTADWARLPYELLERVSSRIINEVQGVNRVALDISSKPPATIEWE